MEIEQAVSHCFLGSRCKLGGKVYTVAHIVKATPRTRMGGRYDNAIELVDASGKTRIVNWGQKVIAYEGRP